MRLILMCFGLTLFLTLGVLVALFGGMIALWSVHRAWLERLVAAIRGSIVLLFFLVLVVVVTMAAVITIHPLVVVTMLCVASPAVAIVTPVTLSLIWRTFLLYCLLSA
jgi:hypothetical protein